MNVSSFMAIQGTGSPDIEAGRFRRRLYSAGSWSIGVEDPPPGIAGAGYPPSSSGSDNLGCCSPLGIGKIERARVAIDSEDVAGVQVAVVERDRQGGS